MSTRNFHYLTGETKLIIISSCEYVPPLIHDCTHGHWNNKQ